MAISRVHANSGNTRASDLSQCGETKNHDRHDLSIFLELENFERQDKAGRNYDRTTDS